MTVDFVGFISVSQRGNKRYCDKSREYHPCNNSDERSESSLRLDLVGYGANPCREKLKVACKRDFAALFAFRREDKRKYSACDYRDNAKQGRYSYVGKMSADALVIKGPCATSEVNMSAGNGEAYSHGYNQYRDSYARNKRNQGGYAAFFGS